MITIHTILPTLSEGIPFILIIIDLSKATQMAKFAMTSKDKVCVCACVRACVCACLCMTLYN